MPSISASFLAIAALAFSISATRAEDLKMQLDGQPWTAMVVNSTVVAMGADKVISISGKLEGDKISVLSFQLAPASPGAPKGHYDLKSGLPKGSAASGIFNTNLVGGDPMEDSFKFQSGSLDVTGYDAASHALSGTFSGVLVSHSGAKKMTVQNGVLDGLVIGGN